MRRIRYIHEHPDWPDFRWDAAALAAPLAALRHKQGRLLGRMEALGAPFRQEAGLATLTADVVKSSAIEGERLDAGRVRSSIASRLGLDAGGPPPLARHEEGLVEVMLDATRRAREPLTAGRLFAWHAALFPTGRRGMHAVTVGAWRRDEAGPMRVVSGPEGRRVHFEAPAADRLPAETAAFLAWFESGPPIDGVVKAGLAHFWFVTLHPFDDGNGHLARAIADMALARAEGGADRFYSTSAQIEREKRDYYRQLERQQRGGLDATPWLAWFLGCLDRALDASASALEGVLLRARRWERVERSGVNDRQRAVLARFIGDSEGPLTTSKYARLAACSPDTALRDLQDLVRRALLARSERGGRSTSYGLADEGTPAP
jgi:Fic family protein